MTAVVRFAASALLALAGCGHPPEPQEGDEEPAQPATVRCEPVRTEQTSGSIAVRGVIAAPPDKNALVAPSVAGRLVEVRVQEGDRVRRGDLLARVEDPSLADSVAEAQAATDAAAAGSEAAHARLGRAQRLQTEGIVARREVEEAQAAAAAADAELRAARSRRRLAVTQAARARVTAPIDGTVIRVLLRVGELVDGTPSTPVAQIADPTTLELAADVPAADLVRLQTDQPASVLLDAVPGETLPARVLALGAAVDPATSLGTVRVRLDAPGPARIGMAAQATLTSGSHPAKVVPASALRRSEDGRDEVVVCDDRARPPRARVRAVQVGPRIGDRVEIVEGVEAGERLVIDRALGLEDGAPLAPASAP